MIKSIMSMLGLSPEAKILKEKERKYKIAVQLQRDGNLREYACVMKEIQELENKYIEMTRGVQG